jgi:hypothetical protein
MRRIPTLLLIAATLAFQGACFAQAQAGRDDTVGAAAPASTATAPDTASAAPRSPFGRVMAVMISALKHQSRERARPVAPVHTTRAGTPLGIEVGAAFRDGLDAGDDAEHATGTGGAAAEALPRAAPPEDLVLRRATLAGPG